MFSLVVAPAGAARSLTAEPIAAMALSVGIALLVVWTAIALSYISDWPIGFFVGTLGAVAFGLARAWTSYRQRRPVRVRLSAEPVP
jgi:zinc/manganese transport system permease protein